MPAKKSFFKKSFNWLWIEKEIIDFFELKRTVQNLDLFYLGVLWERISLEIIVCNKGPC